MRPSALLLLAAALSATVACVPDDYDSANSGDDTSGDTTDTVDTNDTEGAQDPQLVGAWRSEGSDLSPLFVRLDISWVNASFGADGSYEVVTQDSSGQQGTFTGTYTVDTSTTPYGIQMNQSAPYTAIAVGIYAVDGDALTFETVQTVPDYGNTPPSGEFGTSGGTGLSAGDNIQKYVRQ